MGQKKATPPAEILLVCPPPGSWTQATSQGLGGHLPALTHTQNPNILSGHAHAHIQPLRMWRHGEDAERNLERGRHTSREDADQRTWESTEKRKGMRGGRGGREQASYLDDQDDNIDVEWGLRTRDRDDDTAMDIRSAGRNRNRDAHWRTDRSQRLHGALKNCSGEEKWKQQSAKKSKKKQGPSAEHLVCVDDTKETKQAFKFALRNLPQHHSLTLVHGLYASVLGHSAADEELKHSVESKYMKECYKQGRECQFIYFPYSSTGDFAEKACSLAQKRQAKGVIVGRRTGLARKPMEGSVSKSMLSRCSVPITVVSSQSSKASPSHSSF